MKAKMGPNGHRDPIVEAWEMYFNLPPYYFSHQQTDAICTQLSQCKNDEARRLVLGISEQVNHEQ